MKLVERVKVLGQDNKFEWSVDMVPAIRPAQVRDVHSLVDIDLKSYDYPWAVDKWRELAADTTCDILIASLRVEPIGMCVWQTSPDGKEGELLRLAVKPVYRECGIGSLLLATVELEVREKGLEKLVIIVPEVKCFPGHPDDVSQWLLVRRYRAGTPILKDHFSMYGSRCDGFKFTHTFTEDSDD